MLFARRTPVRSNSVGQQEKMGNTYSERISQMIEYRKDECSAKKHCETEGVGIVCTLFIRAGLRCALKKS
jgi:hypothetical protein